MRLKLNPALALLLLAPFIGEAMSGSSPPLELLNPVSLLFTIGLYGCGALLVREIAFIWKRGWLSIFALGASYGIFEEGLMTKSFFDPQWMDVGKLGSYGRFIGINWIWTLELIMFHVVFSTAASILLVWLAFPAQRDKRWLGNKSLAACGVIFLAIIIFGYFAMTPYRPEMPVYGLAIIIAIALVLLARLLPASLPVKNSARSPRLLLLFLAGFAWTFLLFFIVWIIPGTGISQIVPFALLIILGFIGLALVTWLYQKGELFSDRHKLTLAAGGLFFFMLLDLLLGLVGIRGMSLVAIVGALIILLIWRRLPAVDVARQTDGSIEL